MFSGDLGKPFSNWNRGPDTEPQVRLLYHGLGTPHALVYASNPISWVMDACNCLPFLKLNTADAGSPVDSAVADQLGGMEFAPANLPDTGSFFTGDTGSPLPGGVVSPRGPAPMPPAISGFAASGVPLGTITPQQPAGGQIVNNRVVPLWGSRKTLGGS